MNYKTILLGFVMALISGILMPKGGWLSFAGVLVFIAMVTWFYWQYWNAKKEFEARMKALQEKHRKEKESET